MINIIIEVALYLMPYLIMALYIGGDNWPLYMIIPMIPPIHCAITELRIKFFGYYV
jgi:hypothetical protein